VPYKNRLRAAAPELFAALGRPEVPIATVETELVVHRDGGFFGPPIDTFVGAQREREPSDRLISTVIYFEL